MKKKLFLILVLIVSCKNGTVTKKAQESKSLVTNTIQSTSIYFLSKPKDTLHFANRVFPFSFVVNVLKANGFEKEFINNSQESVLKYTTSQDTSIIRHIYRNYSLYFEIKKGDSIRYYERNGFPFYVGNNEILNQSNLYDYKRINYLNISPPYDFYSYYLSHKHLGGNFKELSKNFIQELHLTNQKEMVLLDSLYALHQITEYRYYLQKDKLKFNLYNSYRPVDLKNYVEKDSFKNDLNREDLIKYAFYKEFLNNYTNSKFQIKRITQSNQLILDYKTNFDSITFSNLFSKKIKSFLLYNNLLEIGSNFSQKDFNAYYKKFKKHVNDSIFINSINNKFLASFSDSKDKIKNAYFITKQNKSRELKEIINDNKGKVIYIDFWASWCAPCRSSMPASRKLHTDYKNKDIVFIYASIDKDFEKWEKAVMEEGLPFSKNNLLAVNYPKANFYNELNLKTIPRYLLYSKKGELVNQNAPGPNTDEIIKLMDKYLME